jgi:acetyl esterase
MALDTKTLIGLDATAARFLDGLEKKGGPPLYTLSPAAARAVLLAVQAVDAPRPDAAIEDRTIPGGPTGQVAVRLVRPKGVGGDLPIILYMHGGGWILGDHTTHDRLIRELAVGTGAAVVFVDFDRSPESRFPVAIEQGFAALKWAAGQGGALHLDPSRLALAGDSVGGNMAAVLALMAKERGGPHVDFQVLCYPVTDAVFTTGSYETFADGPWLTREAMRWFWDAYLPDASLRTETMASPLRATLEQLRGLPPALVLTNEFDVLRDEGEAYAHKLARAGVPVTATRLLGAVHDILLLDPLADTPVARGGMRQVVAALREVFARPEEKARARQPGAEAAAARH